MKTLTNQTVKWINYYWEMKTYENQTITTTGDTNTRGELRGIWGQRKVARTNGLWWEELV